VIFAQKQTPFLISAYPNQTKKEAHHRKQSSTALFSSQGHDRNQNADLQMRSRNDMTNGAETTEAIGESIRLSQGKVNKMKRSATHSTLKNPLTKKDQFSRLQSIGSDELASQPERVSHHTNANQENGECNSMNEASIDKTSLQIQLRGKNSGTKHASRLSRQAYGKKAKRMGSDSRGFRESGPRSNSKFDASQNSSKALHPKLWDTP